MIKLKVTLMDYQSSYKTHETYYSRSLKYILKYALKWCKYEGGKNVGTHYKEKDGKCKS